MAVENRQGKPSTLSSEQEERLRTALEERRSATPPVERQTVIPQDEYARRLRNDMLQDRVLAEEARKKNVDYNIQQWNDRIEERWQDASIQNDEMSSDVKDKILDRVDRWESGKGKNQISMLFAGHLGRGKTWSAHAYVHELIRRGILTSGQVYISTETALAAVASSGFEKEKRLNEILNPKYKLYLIDDIGRGSFSNPASRGEIWFEILNNVYTRKLAFVGTTNFGLNPRPDPAPNDPKRVKPSSLEAWVGAASFERLGHMVGKTGYVQFGKDTSDMRRKKGQQWEEDYRARQ